MFGIKKAYCLCLDKRKEHWLDLKNQCESKGLEFNRFIVGDGKILDSQEYDRIDIEDAPIDNWGYGGHETNTEEEELQKAQVMGLCNYFATGAVGLVHEQQLGALDLIYCQRHRLLDTGRG